jgi:hypothetical protein
MGFYNLRTLSTMNDVIRPTFIFIAGALIGGLAATVWFSASQPVPWPGGGVSTSTGSAAALPPDTSGRVSVIGQKAGDTVEVESVTVPPPGVWVTVREVSGTELGNVLGAARARGPVSTLTIPLLRATVPGHAYAVELYRDDGNDAFDITQDSVYVDFDTGNPVIAPFATTN